MKAVVFESPGSVILKDRPKSTRHSDAETLIRNLACGLCGSDLRLMTDPPGMSCEPNTIIGHELVGIVEEPAEGSAFQAGDLVVAQPNIPCRECASCKRGLINLCDDFNHPGATSDGALAEYISLPNEFLHKVPEGLDARTAALAEPLACVLNGATRSNMQPGEPVVILGCGPIGMLFLAYAKLAGASPIIVSEIAPDRVALAREIGADHVVNPLDEDAVEQMVALTSGIGAPTVIDTLGTLLETAFEVVAKAGHVFVFGVNHAAEITVKPYYIVDKEIHIHGIYIGKGTFPLALKLLAEHRDLFAKIVTDVYPVDDWESAKAALMGNRASGKILVSFDPVIA